MGAGSARCCNVYTPEGRKTLAGLGGSGAAGSRKTTAVQAAFEVKRVKEYKAEYSEPKGTIRKNTSVQVVVSKGTGCEYVVRKLEMAQMPCKGMADLNAHFQVLQNLEHPHLCKFIDAFEDRQTLYLIYEKANPLTLFERIRAKSSLTEEEAADYLRQTAMVMAVAHSQGVVHGRFSPRSLILADEDEDEECDVQIKVCDMGQVFVTRCNVLDIADSDKALEVQKYAISPELACEELPKTSNGVIPKGADKNDIWAMGVVFYHMLSGTTPFRVDCRSKLVEQMANKSIKFHEAMWSKLSGQARDLIEQMMRLNPGIRISAGHILKHPWVKVARATFPRKKMLSLLDEMRINIGECEFKRFVLRVIAEQLPQDGKHVATVDSAYRCLDKNGDGILSVEEVVKGLKKHLNKSADDRELEDLFAQLDRDGSHTINVGEFVCASIPQDRSTSLPVLWEAFNAFDKDRSGHIAFDEIEKLVREIEGSTLSKEQTTALCADIRTDLEPVSVQGGIDFDSFVYIMKNSTANLSEAVQKDWNRWLWNTCGVDNYQVRHRQGSESDRWNLKQSGSPRSAYRKRNPRRRITTEPDEAG